MNASAFKAAVAPARGDHRSPPLAIEPERFRNDFNRKPFSIRHDLGDHPLLSLPRLIELAQRLPKAEILVNVDPTQVNIDPTLPRNTLSIAETLRRIEDRKCWVMLKHVEQDPDYRALLDRCLDQVGEHSRHVAPGMRRREAFIFITSPGSVTPYHMDPEYNILLQTSGRKTMYVFDGNDREVLSERTLERYFSGADSNLVFRDEYQAKASVFQLAPGMGVHVPVTFPHWVKNGDEVSISFSVTFGTPWSDRRANLYRMNAWLRRLPSAPAPVGSAAWRDLLKYQTFRMVSYAERLMSRAKAPPPRAPRQMDRDHR